MNAQSKHSLKKSFTNRQAQDMDFKRYSTQLKTIFHYLHDYTSTASMVSKATGISQKCITRYKRDLEIKGKLSEVKKALCKVTNCPAWYLTTNPELFPKTQSSKKLQE